MRVDNDILIPELARLLNEGKEVRFTPSGVSMRPFIEGDQDSVILAPLTQEPCIGDILLVRVTNPQLPPTNHQSPITDHQSPITNHQSPITNHQSPTIYVLHRLIRIEGSIHQTSNIKHQTFILQGDGNLQGEEHCRREDIIGRVKRIEYPSGRRKCLTRGRLWHCLFPLRRWLLKIYRHTWLKIKY